MKPVILVALIGILEALHCDKEFNYYDNYGHGFDVTCQGITKDYLYLLENITIKNEISLRIVNSTLANVASRIFRNVGDVRYLFLENSTISFASTEPIFETLDKLEHLVIKHTDFYVFKHTFSGLKNLEELELSNNNLTEIEAGAFRNLPSLRHLKLTSNLIGDLKYVPLCELQNLRTINLSRNVISSLNGVNFYCKDSKEILDLNLNDKNYILGLHKRDFFSISDISLEINAVDLSYNQIKVIGSSLSDMKYLKFLNLEGNGISKIEYRELNSLRELEDIRFGHNVLESIDERAFSNLENLERLDLSNNKLAHFSVNNTPMLEYVNVGGNILDINSLSSINADYLKTFILSNNKIKDITANAFQKYPELEVLNLAGNQVKLHDHSFGGLKQLKDLTLRNNGIDNLPPILFGDLVNLRKLDLSQNNLRSFAHNGIFAGLGNLEILNISYNFLQELNYALLEPLDNLNILDIAGNRLHYIEYELIISDLPLLSVLNIKSNYLSCEILDRIVNYLRKKGVSYTVNEKFDYEKENVAGIYCTSEQNIVSKGLTNPTSPRESSGLFTLGIIATIILVVIVIGVSLFRIHIYLKRRKYRIDEFELIDE